MISPITNRDAMVSPPLNAPNTDDSSSTSSNSSLDLTAGDRDSASTKSLAPDPLISSERHGFARIFISTRFIVAILVLGGVLCQYAAKLDLSVNIVCMENHTVTDNSTINTNQSTTTVPPQCHRSGKQQSDGPFFWTASQRANLLAAFFYGYLVTEIPGGIMAGKYGSRLVMAAGTTLNSICAFHYGVAAYRSYGLFVFTRVLVGAGSGVILPSASNVWTKWAPTDEKSFLIAIATSGAHLAPILVLPLGGYLCVAAGWKAIFYFVAILEISWVALWLIFFRDSPAKSWITPKKEKDYILAHVDSKRVETNELDAPWKKIFTSKACWGLFLTHTCANWGFYTLLVESPTYMSEVLYFDLSQSGVISAIPYVVIWLTTTISSFTADYLFKHNIITNRTLIRKIMVMLGSWLPAGFLIGLGFVKCTQPILGVVLLALGQGLFGITWGGGHMCNANDLAPVHAGVVFGISNTLATIPGIITPYVTAALTPQNTQAQWQIVFSISAVIMMIGGLIFLFLGSGKPEAWDSDFQVSQHHGSIVRMM